MNFTGVPLAISKESSIPINFKILNIQGLFVTLKVQRPIDKNLKVTGPNLLFFQTIYQINL